MMNILLLGASGSIGEQTIDIIKQYPKHFSLVAFSVGKRVHKIEQILKDFPTIKHICVQNKDDYERMLKQYPNIHFYYGDQGLIDIILMSKPDMMVNALVGFVGFIPTVHALKNNIDVALSNKESIVVGGSILKEILKTSTAKIYPIDSEHVAIDKCLKGNKKDVKKIILTASGGSFRHLTREQLVGVSVEDALKHPSWSMGNKITIDSATMMNKGFEMIEAHFLFDIPMNKIDIVLHDESKVHSLIECKDGSYVADIGPSDMRIPIAYALFKKKRIAKPQSKLELKDFMNFHFHEFDERRFPCVSYAKEAMKHGGTMPTVLNASNEEAVYAFLNKEISFLSIEVIIKRCMDSHRVIDNPTIEDIVYVDQLVRQQVKKLIKEGKF